MSNGDIMLDIDEYEDADESYTIEPDDTEESSVVANRSYSYKTMSEIVQFANTHQCSYIKRRYRLIKDRKHLRRIKKIKSYHYLKKSMFWKFDKDFSIMIK